MLQPKHSSLRERNAFAFSALFALGMQPVFTQEALPVIRANTKRVDIRDGDDFKKGIWIISLNIKPDVYQAERFKARKRVTFYTDCDSIFFDATPGKTYNFIILLNTNDTAYTQLATSKQPTVLYEKNGVVCDAGFDTIPFTLGWNNAIQFKGRINQSEVLKMMFDTGANGVILSADALSKNLKLKIDGSMQGFGFGGASNDSTSKNNNLQIEGLVWRNMDVLVKYAGKPHADVVVGYNVFDGKAVEIDYENRWPILHAALPPKTARYAQHQLKFKAGLSYIKLVLVAGVQKMEGWFDFDTGASGALFVNGAFAKANNLHEHLKKLGSDALQGSGPAKVAVDNLVLPHLLVSTFAFGNVPLAVAQTSMATGPAFNIVGNDVLKRFNCIIDYRNDVVYLQPNSLQNTWYLQQKIRYIKWSGCAFLLLLFTTIRMGFLKRCRAKKRRATAAANGQQLR